MVHFVSMDENGGLTVEWINGDRRVVLGVDLENGRLAFDFFRCPSQDPALLADDINIQNADEVRAAFDWLETKQ